MPRLPTILFACCWLGFLARAQEKPHHINKDGVAVWYRDGKPAEAESFLNGLWRFVFNEAPPFGKSVAFLAGVSSYAKLRPQLPSVGNDLEDMRRLLLGVAGFDEVWVVRDQKVNRDLIERYVKAVLPGRVGESGRLLFYYSGHGGDGKGQTGYMQFSGAEPGQFYGRQVLKINDIYDWSKELPLRHFMAVLDCCASGLAFASKSGQGCETGIAATLSGDGSRTVMTAGTADQKTYALAGREQRGNGVFTLAFVNAFQQNLGPCELLTAHDIHAYIEKEVAAFAQSHRKQLNPRIVLLDDHLYRGRFVFVKPEDVAAAGRRRRPADSTVKPKGDDLGGFGWVAVYAYEPGTLLIDGETIETLEKGDARRYRLPLGTHTLTLITADTSLAREVEIAKGRTIELDLKAEKKPVKTTTPPLPSAATEPIPGELKEIPFPGRASLSIGMRWIPKGRFTMGSPLDESQRVDNETQHRVTLSRGFWMGQTEVTQSLWKAVMGGNPSGFKGDGLPVEQVSWLDVEKFLNELNRMMGPGFRLPTEAEWEYACRAGGSSTPFHYGSKLDAGLANFDGNRPYGGASKGEYREKTTVVGLFEPNAWGLRDMHGNLWEWCSDWLGDYGNNAVTDPPGPKQGSGRVVRGGGWINSAGLCRSAYRSGRSPVGRSDYVGFRLVRTP